MSNPLYGMLNNQLPNNLGNLSNFMTNFNNFRQTLGNNPSQYAENLVKQMMSSGKISQEQFNQASQMASMIQQKMGIY